VFEYKERQQICLSVLFINFNASSYIETEHEIYEKRKLISANATWVREVRGTMSLPMASAHLT